MSTYFYKENELFETEEAAREYAKKFNSQHVDSVQTDKSFSNFQSYYEIGREDGLSVIDALNWASTASTEDRMTHYAVQHGRGWSKFLGLCRLVGGKITEATFAEGPIVAHDADGQPLGLWGINIPEDGNTPVDSYGTYVAVKLKDEAFDLPEEEAYHTDAEAQRAFHAA